MGGSGPIKRGARDTGAQTRPQGIVDALPFHHGRGTSKAAPVRFRGLPYPLHRLPPRKPWRLGCSALRCLGGEEHGVGPCAEGTKTPSVVPGGIRAEGRHTQSAPGHKAEVIARVLAARPPLHPTWAHDLLGGGGKRRLGTITLKKRQSSAEERSRARQINYTARKEKLFFLGGSFGFL